MLATEHAGSARDGDRSDGRQTAFARSEEGVDFGSMDDEPARLLLMILVPESGSEDHRQILSSLSRALMHEEVRDELYAAESPADAEAALDAPERVLSTPEDELADV